jgi:hypothetical protein
VETSDEVGSDGQLERLGEETGETFGLVEFAFALADGVEGNGDNTGPGMGSEIGDGDGQPELGEEGFEPEGPMILVVMDEFAGGAFGADGGSGAAEGEVEPTAVRAFELVPDVAGEREATAFTGGWLDELDGVPAVVADEAIGRDGVGDPAELATFGIEQ